MAQKIPLIPILLPTLITLSMQFVRRKKHHLTLLFSQITHFSLDFRTLCSVLSTTGEFINYHLFKIYQTKYSSSKIINKIPLWAPIYPSLSLSTFSLPFTFSFFLFSAINTVIFDKKQQVNLDMFYGSSILYSFCKIGFYFDHYLLQEF